MSIPTRLLAASLFLLSVGCGPISILGDSLKIPAGAKVTLSEVKFDYAKWTKQDAEFLAKMREKETLWRTLVQAAFAKEANKRGIDQGSDPGVSVRILIDDLDPGSQALRYWIGFGSGKGTLLANADCGTHGSLQMKGSVSGGFFGGSFDRILRTVGTIAAQRIAAARK